MAILGWKNEAVATTEITKLLTAVSVGVATMFGAGEPIAGLVAAFGTQIVSTGLGFIPMKGKNPLNAREKVTSEVTEEQEVDKNRREVRREIQMVEPVESDYLFVGAVEEDDEDDEFTEQFSSDTNMFVGG